MTGPAGQHTADEITATPSSARLRPFDRSTAYGERVVSPSDSISPPLAFARAENDLRSQLWRQEFEVDQMPAPQRIAPYAAAIMASVVVEDEDAGNGRLVLLHDPAGNESWQGTFRCVTFARAEVEPEMVTDPLLAQVGWSWLIDALESHQADFTAPSGTVTSVSSQSFGGMEDEPARAEIEIRASWTPLLDGSGAGLPAHLAAWQDLMCTTAGLPPLPEGVTPMQGRRSRS